jgi:putative ABC transport system permease protein
LFGLAVGFTVFLMSVIYVYFETHFEDFYTKSDRIYRVTYQFKSGEGYDVHWARVPVDYVNELPHDVPAFKTLIRFQNHERKDIRVGQEKFKPEHAYVTDKAVFEVFDFKLITGNPATALAEPRSIVLTQSLAQRVFGDQNPMDREVFVIGDLDKTETAHRVTGIIEDLPANTHLPVDMLVSFKDPSERSGWAYTYALLQEGTKIETVVEQMPGFIAKYEQEEEARKQSLPFQPLQDIHLHSNLAREIVPNGSAFYVKIVGYTGIFILAIALINFINLNGAMALGRAKEFGMRKVLGAGKNQLIVYMLVENMLHNLVAMIIGALIAYSAFPALQYFVPIQFIVPPELLVVVSFLTAVCCGLVAGAYPSILLTAIKPIEAVRHSKSFGHTNKENLFSLKRAMVTLQFCISIILCGSALIAYQQFRYLNEKNLGIDRTQVIAIPGVPDQVKNGYTSFKDLISVLPGVLSVAACMEVPSREIRDTGPVLVEGVNEDDSRAPVMDVQVIDPDFVPLLGIQLLAGENIPGSLTNEIVPEFSPDYPLDKYLLEQRRVYLINETAMRQLGWQSPEEAIGRQVNWSIGGLKLSYGPITGVVRDFHQETLKNKVDPVIMVYEPVWLRTFLVKTHTKNMRETISNLHAAWDKLFPMYPMEYHFLDDLYENLYKGERVQLQMLYIFSGLAVAIALTGLVGLIAYTLRTRSKEIAIRKVLGATSVDLVRLISREYLLVLLIGGGLAIPVSVYGLRQWLGTFAYRIDISPYLYLVTLAAVAMLLLLTIGLQTLNSARMNPADTLRDE